MLAGEPIGETSHFVRGVTRRLLRVVRRILLVALALLALAAVVAWATAEEFDLGWGAPTGPDGNQFEVYGAWWSGRLMLFACDWDGPDVDSPFELGAERGEKLRLYALWDWSEHDWELWIWSARPWRLQKSDKLGGMIGRGPRVVVPTWFLVLAFGTWPAFVLLRHGLRRERWEQRRKQGLCGHCGYNLTGLTSARCPECGTEVEAVSARAKHEGEQASG
jgi:hypothetical protein